MSVQTIAAIASAVAVVGGLLLGALVNDLDQIERQQRIIRSLPADSKDAERMAEALSRSIQRHHDRVTNRTRRVTEYWLIGTTFALAFVCYRLTQTIGDPSGAIETSTYWVFYAVGMAMVGLGSFMLTRVASTR